MAEKFIPVAKVGDVKPGAAIVVEAGFQEIALCNVDGRIHAVDNICTHADERLGPCALEGCAIECPRHGALFDVRTGEVLSMPASHPLAVYETKIEGDAIFVKVDVDE